MKPSGLTACFLKTCVPAMSKCVKSLHVQNSFKNAAATPFEQFLSLTPLAQSAILLDLFTASVYSGYSLRLTTPSPVKSAAFRIALAVSLFVDQNGVAISPNANSDKPVNVAIVNNLVIL